MVRSRRAWLYVLSIAALVVPAAGIAYLGAVSYRDERGAVSAQNGRQRQAALAISDRITRAIGDALDAAEQAAGSGGAPSAALARHWFWTDRALRLRAPRPELPMGDLGAGLERSAACAGGLLEDCMRELSTRQARLAQLAAAERAEASSAWPEARRHYGALAGFADTGPSALLGLRRTLGRAADPRALEPLAELERRFADRSALGLPVPVVAAVLRAEAAATQDDPGPLLALAEQLLADGGDLASVARLGAVAHLRAHLPQRLVPGAAARLARLDERAEAIRREARAAAGLAIDLPELARTATAAWRGRPAARAAGRTLIYRKRADGGVLGISVDAALLEAAAGPASDLAGLASGARAVVLPAGAAPGAGLRTIQQVPLGAALPHLTVAVANPLAEPDPLDEVIRARSQRHVVYTSALALALGLGLLVTIRGAARARELAQLKSDFVSTVSHELKTPLTSIRMFAEMLQQGVARGDPAKLERYHGVIIQESQRLGALIANLLDYAQIEKGTRRYARTREPVHALARDAAATFEALRDAEGGERNPLVVEVSPEAMLAQVEVDRDVVIGAVLNLLANAAKYGGAAHPIELRVAADDAAAVIAVRDHGPGIPAAEQARIFREFYRAPEAYRAGVLGTGLGLALVKRHIEALGGTVEVASRLGAGATFTIRLPRAAASEAA